MLQEAHAITVPSKRPRVLDDYLSENEAAAEVRQKPRTLRKWRERGEGPPYARIGRQIIYPRAGLIDWLSAKIVKPVRASRK